MFNIDIANEQAAHAIDEERLRRAVRSVLQGEQVAQATVSVAIVDDAAIHRLNRQYLQHDFTTDVLSFVLDRSANALEGEVIASIETAAAAARSFRSTIGDELLLYVVHGTLHLVGYDDQEPQAAATMRARERRYLAAIGCEPREVESPWPEGEPSH